MESSEEGEAVTQVGWGWAGRGERGHDRLSGALLCWEVPVCMCSEVGELRVFQSIPWESQHQGEQWGFHRGPGMRSGLSATAVGRREAWTPRRTD